LVEVEVGRKISSSSDDEEVSDIVSSSVEDEASEESVGIVKVEHDHHLGKMSRKKSKS